MAAIVKRRPLPAAWQSVNVKDYGATGNGTTSDQVAVALAVSKAYAAGADLYWPPGTYLTTANIANFHSVRHSGPGVVKRGSNLFYISPTKSQSNYFYVTTSGSTSNDGLSSSEPTTAQTALNALEARGTLTGKWYVEMAAGTYTPSAGLILSDVVTLGLGSTVIIRGPSVTLNTQPSVVWDGASATSLYNGIAFQNCDGYFEVRDIEVVNWGDPSVEVFRAGVLIASTKIVTLTNVWATDCGSGWYARTRSAYFFLGGLIDNCWHGIHELFNVVRSSMAGDDYSLSTTVQNCHFGFFSKEHCTGHFDSTQFLDNQYGMMMSRSCTANISHCRLWRNDYGIVGRAGCFVGGGYIDVGMGTSDANTGSAYEFDYTSGFFFNEANVTFGTMHGQGEKLAAHYISGTGVSHTGDTSAYTYVTFDRKLLGPGLVMPGSSVRCRIFGRKSGSAGAIAMALKFENANAATTNIPAAMTNFVLDIYVLCTGASSQVAFCLLNGTGADDVCDRQTRTIAMAGGYIEVKVEGTHVDAADTLTIDGAYLYTTGPLIHDSGITHDPYP